MSGKPFLTPDSSTTLTANQALSMPADPLVPQATQPIQMTREQFRAQFGRDPLPASPQQTPGQPKALTRAQFKEIFGREPDAMQPEEYNAYQEQVAGGQFTDLQSQAGRDIERVRQSGLMQTPIIGPVVAGLGLAGASFGDLASSVTDMKEQVIPSNARSAQQGTDYGVMYDRASAALAEGQPGFVNETLRGVAQSIPTMTTGAGVSMLTGNPALGVASMIGMSGAQSMNNAYRETGDPGYALRSGLIEAGITAMFQGAGKGGLEAAATRGFKSGFDAFRKVFGEEVPEELAILFFDSTNRALSGYDPSRNMDKETIERDFYNMAQVAAQTAVMAGLGGAGAAMRNRPQPPVAQPVGEEPLQIEYQRKLGLDDPSRYPAIPIEPTSGPAIPLGRPQQPGVAYAPDVAPELGIAGLGNAEPGQRNQRDYGDTSGAGPYFTPNIPGALTDTPIVEQPRQAPKGLRRYEPIFEQAAQSTDGVVSKDLLMAVAMVESGGNPKAVSPKGAKGLFQFMDPTAKEVGITDPFDPKQSIMGGAQYLGQLLDRAGGDLDRALEYYNFGMGNVESGKPLPQETIDYKRKVRAAMASIQGDNTTATLLRTPPEKLQEVADARVSKGKPITAKEVREILGEGDKESVKPIRDWVNEQVAAAPPVEEVAPLPELQATQAPEVAPSPVGQTQPASNLSELPAEPPPPREYIPGKGRVISKGQAPLIEAAKQEYRDVVNSDIQGKQRVEAIERARNLVDFYESTRPEKMELDYTNGDQIAYTGVEQGDFREFIYLEGAKKGTLGSKMKPDVREQEVQRRQNEWKEQQEQFARLNPQPAQPLGNVEQLDGSEVGKSLATWLEGAGKSKPPQELTIEELKQQREETGTTVIQDRYLFHTSPVAGLTSLTPGTDGNVWLSGNVHQGQSSGDSQVYAIDRTKLEPSLFEKQPNGYPVYKGVIPSDAVIPLGNRPDGPITDSVLHGMFSKPTPPARQQALSTAAQNLAAIEGKAEPVVSEGQAKAFDRLVSPGIPSEPQAKQPSDMWSPSDRERFFANSQKTQSQIADDAEESATAPRPLLFGTQDNYIETTYEQLLADKKITKKWYDKNRWAYGSEKADIQAARTTAKTNHRYAVEYALSHGKPVPASVLADYPDLAAKYAEQPAKPAESTPQPSEQPPLTFTRVKVGKKNAYDTTVAGRNVTIDRTAAEPGLPFEVRVEGQSGPVDFFRTLGEAKEYVSNTLRQEMEADAEGDVVADAPVAPTPAVKDSPTTAPQPSGETGQLAESLGGPVGMISEFVGAGKKSAEELRNKITNTRYGPIERGQDTILFEVDGVPYKGVLKGDNADYVVGMSPEADSKIALRVLLSKDASPISGKTTPAKSTVSSTTQTSPRPIWKMPFKQYAKERMASENLTDPREIVEREQALRQTHRKAVLEAQAKGEKVPVANVKEYGGGVAEAAPVKAEGQPKQPWEMTREEFKKATEGVRGNTADVYRNGVDDASVANTMAFDNERIRLFGKKGGDEILALADKYGPIFEHRSIVESAAREGKPIPPAVLAEYPDLQAKASTPAKPAPAAGKGVPQPTPQQNLSALRDQAIGEDLNPIEQMKRNNRVRDAFYELYPGTSGNAFQNFLRTGNPPKKPKRGADPTNPEAGVISTETPRAVWNALYDLAFKTFVSPGGTQAEAEAFDKARVASMGISNRAALQRKRLANQQAQQLRRAFRNRSEQRLVRDAIDGLKDGAFTMAQAKEGMTPQEMMQSVKDVLNGKASKFYVPKGLYESTKAQRDLLDAASRQILESGIATSQGQVEAVKRGIGLWLRRSYEVHDNSNWVQQVIGTKEWRTAVSEMEKEWQEATQSPESLTDIELIQFGRRHLPDVKNSKEIDKIIQSMEAAENPEVLDPKARKDIEDALRALPPRTKAQFENRLKTMLANMAQEGREGFLNRRLGSQDRSSLMRRKTIPKWLRDVMGEYRDPEINFARSAEIQAQMIAAWEFAASFYNAGKGKFVFDKVDDLPANDKTEYVTMPDNPKYGMLAGKLVSKDIKAMLDENKNNPDSFLKMVSTISGGVRWMKTVGNVYTGGGARNFMSSAMAALARGDVPVSAIGRVFKDLNSGKTLEEAVARSLGISARDSGGIMKALRDHHEKMVELGVHDTDPNFNLVRERLKDSFFGKKDFDPNNPHILSKTSSNMADLWLLGDNVWKSMSFMETMNRYEAKAKREGWNQQQRERHAADIVRAITPTYDAAFPIVNKLKNSAANVVWQDFITWPAERVRNKINLGKLIYSEINSGDPKLVASGMGRLAATVAYHYTMTAALSTLGNWALGGDDPDEDWGVRELLPHWMRFAPLHHLGKNEDGSYSVIDLGFTDADSLFNKGLLAMLEGKPKDAAMEWLNTFFGTSIAFDTAIELYFNHKATGSPVYLEHDEWHEKLSKAVKYATMKSGPPVAGIAWQLYDRANGKAIETETRPLADRISSLIGLSFWTMQPSEAFNFKANAAASHFRDISQSITTEKKEYPQRNLKDIQKSYEGRRNKYAAELVEYGVAARVAGVKPNELRNQMKDAAVREDYISAIMKGIDKSYKALKDTGVKDFSDVSLPTGAKASGGSNFGGSVGGTVGGSFGGSVGGEIR